MVDSSAPGEDQLTAQVSGIDHTHQSHEARNDGYNTIPWTSEEAKNKGDKIEDRGTCIEEGVIEANASLSTVGIAPIGQASHNRAQRSQEAHDHGDEGSIRCPGGMRDQPDDIKDGSEHPGRNGHIGNDRVQWMTEPCPIEQALEASGRFPLRANDDPYCVLQGIAQSLRERLRRGWRYRSHFGLRNRYRRFGHSVFSL